MSDAFFHLLHAVLLLANEELDSHPAFKDLSTACMEVLYEMSRPDDPTSPRG